MGDGTTVAAHLPQSAALRRVPACGGIEVWHAQLGLAPAELRVLRATLAPDELRRAAAYGRPELRDCFIARRGLLRGLLAHYTNVPAAAIALLYGPNGKPRLADAGPAVRFNLASSSEAALFAFSAAHDVGVDIERIRAGLAFDSIAADHFTAAERALLTHTPEPQRLRLCFVLWARKEACTKALGQGLDDSLRHFEVAFACEAGGDPQPMHVAVPDTKAGELTVLDLDAAPGYAAALAFAAHVPVQT